uniref:SMB domain-containing protein n=1 Tax=Zooxanthella nutricula TaxID=1333877 RepID=A0A7S2JGM7_9DINO
MLLAVGGAVAGAAAWRSAPARGTAPGRTAILESTDTILIHDRLRTAGAGRFSAPQDNGCHEPVAGSDCDRNISWAKSQGILRHEDWYPGLSPYSSRRDFQEHLFRTKSPGGCPRPCPAAELRARALQTCDFEYNGGPTDLCFCQLAKNRGCANLPCACPQGCDAGAVWDGGRSVTFKNRAQALGCPQPVALLTIPKAYISNVKSLHTWCPSQMQALLQDMLFVGFQRYTAHVGPGPVHQCIHAATHVSMSWLHLHTFCGGGHVDNMPTSPDVAWCDTMDHPEQAAALAQRAAGWVDAFHGPRRPRAPRNCAEMGCDQSAPAHFCACNGKCQHFHDCCSDYQAKCQAR